MSNEPETSARFGCPQCSYKTEWSFQLDHHVRRQHETVYQTELFHAIFEPQLHCCVTCEFKSFCQLDVYQHCVREHKLKVNEDGTVHQDDGYCEQFGCFPGCKFEAFPILSAAKHYDHCGMVEIATEVSCQDASRPIKSEIDFNRCAAVSSITFHCAMCSFTAKYKRSLQEHVRLQHANPEDIVWYNCGNCLYKTKYKRNLKIHALKHANPDNVKWYNCDKCSFRAKLRTHLKRHMLTHALSEEVVWHACNNCSLETKRKDSLKQHMLTHVPNEEVDWHKCNECSFKTKHKCNLKRHILQHVNPEEIEWEKCDKCSYQTKKQDNHLKQHMLIHATSEEVHWYKCNECSFETKRKGSLKKHNLQHVNPEEIERHKSDRSSQETKRKDCEAKHVTNTRVTNEKPYAKKTSKQNTEIERNIEVEQD